MATSESRVGSDQPPVEDTRGELQSAVPKAAETLPGLLDADDETEKREMGGGSRDVHFAPLL